MRLKAIIELFRDKRFRDALNETDEALSKNSDNPALWILRGDLIQLQDGSESNPSLDEAEQAYRKALDLDPQNLEAIESLAHYFDAIRDDSVKANEFAAKYIEITNKKRADMDAIISGTSWKLSHAPHHR